jgi:hypothetical protein
LAESGPDRATLRRAFVECLTVVLIAKQQRTIEDLLRRVERTQAENAELRERVRLLRGRASGTVAAGPEPKVVVPGRSAAGSATPRSRGAEAEERRRERLTLGLLVGLLGLAALVALVVAASCVSRGAG